MFGQIGVDGSVGRETATATQKFLVHNGYKGFLGSSRVDGNWGDATAKGLQQYLKDKGYDVGVVDGKLRDGPWSTRKMQQFLYDNGFDPGPIDGQWGGQTVRAWQRFLNDYQGKPVAQGGKMFGRIGVDGQVGEETATATQKFLEYKGYQRFLGRRGVDGNWGKETAKGLQQFLKDNGYDVGVVDGKLRDGPVSTAQMQQFLYDKGFDPGPIDGHWGGQTVCAWQSFLNAYQCRPVKSGGKWVHVTQVLPGQSWSMSTTSSISTGIATTSSTTVSREDSVSATAGFATDFFNCSATASSKTSVADMRSVCQSKTLTQSSTTTHTQSNTKDKTMHIWQYQLYISYHATEGDFVKILGTNEFAESWDRKKKPEDIMDVLFQP